MGGRLQLADGALLKLRQSGAGLAGVLVRGAQLADREAEHDPESGVERVLLDDAFQHPDGGLAMFEAGRAIDVSDAHFHHGDGALAGDQCPGGITQVRTPAIALHIGDAEVSLHQFVLQGAVADGFA